MRVLITGAGGFCGTHLRRFLEGDGVECHTLGPRSTGEGHHLADPSDVDGLTRAVQAANPDYVIHLAGVSAGAEFLSYYQINVMYGANLLEALARAGREDCPVLLAGTSAEYGRVETQDLPIRENTPPRPYSHYGASKLAQTLMGVMLSREGRRLVMVRPFNLMGPGMPEHLVVQSMARQLAEVARGRRPPVLDLGNLNSSRDFVPVHDAVRIYWQLIRNPAAYGQIVNVCSGRPVKIGDLLERFLRVSGIRADVRSDPRRMKPVDIPVHYGSREKLLSLAGPMPEPDLDLSLAEIWRGVMDNPKDGSG